MLTKVLMYICLYVYMYMCMYTGGGSEGQLLHPTVPAFTKRFTTGWVLARSATAPIPLLCIMYNVCTCTCISGQYHRGSLLHLCGSFRTTCSFLSLLWHKGSKINRYRDLLQPKEHVALTCMCNKLSFLQKSCPNLTIQPLTIMLYVV